MVARMARIVAVFCVTFGLWISSAKAQPRNLKRFDLVDEPDIAYKPPEEFSAGRLDEFQKQAEQLWTTHPDHPYASRAMFDWLLVAPVRQIPAADIERVQFELLIQHPSSIYTRHVVAGTNPQELRKQLSLRFEQRQELNEHFLTQFGRLVLVGISVHGPAWVTSDDFGLQCLLAARVAKLGGLTVLLESRLEEAPAELKKILKTGFDPKATVVDRYVRLGEFGLNKSARMVQRALWNQLSDDEQQQPRVQVALAEQSLREGRWDLALPIAQRLRKEEPDNPRWWLWSGCCLVAVGRDAEGKACLKQVVKLDAESDAGKIASQLLPVVTNLSQSEADCTAVLDELTQRVMKAAPQVLSFEVSFSAKDGEPVRMQFQFEGSQFRMACWKRNRPRAGFQSNPEGCQFFTDEEATVLELAGRQYQMAFGYQFVETTGGLARNLTTNLGADNHDLRFSLRHFLDSPALANGGWQTLLSRRRAVGTFVVPVEVTKSGRTLRWLSLDLVEMKIQETRCQLSSEGDLQEFEIEGMRLHTIQWGVLGEAPLPKFDWPDSPVRRIANDDVAGMMRLMTLMTKVTGFDDLPVTAKTEPASSKR